MSLSTLPVAFWAFFSKLSAFFLSCLAFLTFAGVFFLAALCSAFSAAFLALSADLLAFSAVLLAKFFSFSIFLVFLALMLAWTFLTGLPADALFTALLIFLTLF